MAGQDLPRVVDYTECSIILLLSDLADTLRSCLSEHIYHLKFSLSSIVNVDLIFNHVAVRCVFRVEASRGRKFSDYIRRQMTLRTYCRGRMEELKLMFLLGLSAML